MNVNNPAVADRLDDEPIYFGDDRLYSVEYVSSISQLKISGTAATATSAGGPLRISSADGGATSGNSGNTTFTTGDSTSGNTGTLQIGTGDASDGNSGRVDIVVGNASGDTGDINIAAAGRAKVGFFGDVSAAQQSTVANAAGTDAAIIDAIRDALVAYGLLA